MNYAESRHVRHWHSHPLIGDPSFDTFAEYSGNPVHVGVGVWDWPVNGYFFIDPVSGNWYFYVSLYSKGYVHLGVITLLRSTDGGASWHNTGPVFDGRGLADRYTPKDATLATLDASVVYEDGIYHMIYGWGSLKEEQGGIAYASASRPEGPFIKHAHPLRNETDQPLLKGMYKRTYASTLIRRSEDWLIVAMMSMSRNTGGSWSLAALVADRPDGPYGDPAFLLYPQSLKYHPAPLEFYPAYVHGGYVYAPATSVGSNRSYQAVFRAELEKAHLEEAWELHQEGSCWHSFPRGHERYGIWGQTYSGQVTADGMLHAMYPALNERGEGTINSASRPWAEPYADRFVLSANNAPAVSFVRKGYEEFAMIAEIVSTGLFTVAWGWNGPVGSTVMPRWADGEPDPRMFADGIGLAVQSGAVALIQIARDGTKRILAIGGEDGETLSDWAKSDRHDYDDRRPFGKAATYRITVVQRQDGCKATVNGIEMEIGLTAVPGRIGIIASGGVIAECSRLDIQGEVREHWVNLLPSEGLAGSAQSPDRWEPEESADYVHGIGYFSVDRRGFSEEIEHRLKWNFRGDAFRLRMPVKAYGRATAYLDGRKLEELVLRPEDGADTFSRVVLEQNDLTDEHHALVLILEEGVMRCDGFSYRTSRNSNR
ncbi:hypothetical protein D7Z26_25555 [Cohnella endophytica]|uniref:Uncharacterized protein n=1 Tax=Cohnella endophytica TaxID=2419778 RepID=A0A494X405_9BACL|nr:hypothetical protein [Cohnella endophytica]RKP45427.1 hypothetical protein D7Z26_25555 [Cohnella endophytica]